MLPPVESELVGRLVGYLEYSRALALLDRLVASASAEELRVMEEIVRSRDEYAVYTNLSRRLERSPSSLSEPPLFAGDNFERRGLGWVMALGRVELGAMMAGFTDRPQPFAIVPPTRYELPQYKEVLLDSLRTHYVALRNDPVAQFYWSHRGAQVTRDDRLRGRQGINEQQAIAYSRRVLLVEEFAKAVGELGQGQLTPAQAAELDRMRADLAELKRAIFVKVLALGQTRANLFSSSTHTSNVDYRYCSGCPRMRVDLAALLIDGSAKREVRDVTNQPVGPDGVLLPGRGSR